MSVPRCKKKRGNSSERIFNKAKNVLKAELETEYNSIAEDMSITAGTIYHYALERAFGFTIDEDRRLQEEIAIISGEIKNETLDIDDIRAHQEEKGLTFM